MTGGGDPAPAAATPPAERRVRLALVTIGAAALALISAGATLERSHWQTEHYYDSIVTTSSPAPAQQAIFPSGAPDEVLRSDPSPGGGVSLSSTPPVAATSDFQNSIVVAQVHALTAIAAVKACTARHGVTGDCTKATDTSLGTDTGLTIVHTAPQPGDVRVIRQGPVYSATAAAARGVWYAVTVNVQNGAESRTCLSHHGKQRCAAPNW